MNMMSLCFTICMDVIDSVAPGVKCATVLGLYPHTVLELAKRIIPSDRCLQLSIVDDPTYDTDNRTAKLVANLIASFLK